MNFNIQSQAVIARQLCKESLYMSLDVSILTHERIATFSMHAPQAYRFQLIHPHLISGMHASCAQVNCMCHKQHRMKSIHSSGVGTVGTPGARAPAHTHYIFRDSLAHTHYIFINHELLHTDPFKFSNTCTASIPLSRWPRYGSFKTPIGASHLGVWCIHCDCDPSM